MQGCRVAAGIGVTAGMWSGCRDVEWLQGCGDCRDAGWLQGCRRVAGMGVGCRDGVIAEMEVVAGLQGCIDARWLQAEGWLQGCRMG